MRLKQAQLAVLLTAILVSVGATTASAVTPRAVSSKASCGKLLKNLNEHNLEVRDTRRDLIELIQEDIINYRNQKFVEKRLEADPDNKQLQAEYRARLNVRDDLRLQIHTANSQLTKYIKAASTAVTAAMDGNCKGRVLGRIEAEQKEFFTQRTRFNKRRQILNREYEIARAR